MYELKKYFMEIKNRKDVCSGCALDCEDPVTVIEFETLEEAKEELKKDKYEFQVFKAPYSYEVTEYAIESEEDGWLEYETRDISTRLMYIRTSEYDYVATYNSIDKTVRVFTGSDEEDIEDMRYHLDHVYDNSSWELCKNVEDFKEWLGDGEILEEVECWWMD